MIKDRPHIVGILNPVTLYSAVRLFQQNYSSLNEVETELLFVLAGFGLAIWLELLECMKPYMTRIAIAENNRVTLLRTELMLRRIEAEINRWSFSGNSARIGAALPEARPTEPVVNNASNSAPHRHSR